MKNVLGGREVPPVRRIHSIQAYMLHIESRLSQRFKAVSVWNFSVAALIRRIHNESTVTSPLVLFAVWWTSPTFFVLYSQLHNASIVLYVVLETDMHHAHGQSASEYCSCAYVFNMYFLWHLSWHHERLFSRMVGLMVLDDDWFWFVLPSVLCV